MGVIKDTLDSIKELTGKEIDLYSLIMMIKYRYII